MSSTANPSASSSAAAGIKTNSNLKIVGIILAITSGLLIGSSFVFKKKGLLRSQAGQKAGEGVAYLKSPLWWLGMSMMILGELCNFAAYAFVEALVVTPLGALSVVICAILSSLFLNEKLSFFGWLGCGLCIIGSIIIALNTPQEATVGQITEFQKLFLAPGFLVYASCLIIASLVIIFVFGPKYGTKSMLWYIFVCSMIGGISVSVTTGLGAAIVTSVEGDNQFKHWFIYFLLIFIIITLVTEVYYLNMALALFNTAMVTPTYYVIFTFFSMVTTVVLFQGLKASATQIITIVMAFLVICAGITILQMSKVDPTSLNKLDRRSTILLQAARSNTEKMEEKDITGLEDPGMDAIRGQFGPLGSIIRARSAKRMSQASTSATSRRSRHGPAPPLPTTTHDGLQRHQLYDAPMPRGTDDRVSVVSSNAPPTPLPKTPTIKFGNKDTVHTYHPTSSGSATAVHEQREVHHRLTSPLSSSTALPTVQESTPKPSSMYPEDLEAEIEARGPRSAPASRFEGTPGLPRGDDPFEYAPATSTAASFGGSAPYRGAYRDADEDSDRERSLDGGAPSAHRHSRRGRAASQRGYPLTAGADDREESISLVHPPSLDDEYEDDDVARGGIRLVSPAPRR
ncbi:DUF803-domain-containing protein [Rickenella mellea]|uniref:DUF803-domain-containing protein n=1 Tax=Rickenella mellea TaxID=50990 RepID=A0A4Y7PQ28_9AGAM|nr:DUF803-domain-containing protein [Rickenella mellea]